MANKRAVNLSIDAALIDEAKAFGTNMSALLEQSLIAAHREKRHAKWREENAAALAAWNAYVDEHGIWADKYKA